MTDPVTGPGRFVWHDLITADAGKALGFYSELFGWKATELPTPAGTYRMIHCGAGPIGGIVERAAAPCSHWLGYVAVADVDASVVRATDLGGRVHLEPVDIPDTGRMAVIADPAGATLALYAGNEQSQGASVTDLCPGRVCWNELWTPDPAAVLPFYEGLFGWQDQPMDMGPAGTYHLLKLPGADAGGMMAAHEGCEPAWCAYFLCASVDDDGARAATLGARVVVPARDIPGVGRFSVLCDPTGAGFALFQGAAGC